MAGKTIRTGCRDGSACESRTSGAGGEFRCGLARDKFDGTNTVAIPFVSPDGWLQDDFLVIESWLYSAHARTVHGSLLPKHCEPETPIAFFSIPLTDYSINVILNRGVGCRVYR
jgi:hypothetical protein